MPIFSGAPKPITILQKNTGWLVPSLAAANAATYSQTGNTVTVTSTAHHIPATVHNGKSVYLAIGSGAAVTGWFANFQYVDANTFTCQSSVSQSTSGTVNTNLAETTIADLTVTLPGGSMSAAGFLADTVKISVYSSANNKVVWKKYGGSIYAKGVFGAVGSSYPTFRLDNKNSVSAQIGSITDSDRNFGTAGVLYALSIDSSVDQSLTTTAQCVTASEYVAIETNHIAVTN
jgi:hypothetical protein